MTDPERLKEIRADWNGEGFESTAALEDAFQFLLALVDQQQKDLDAALINGQCVLDDKTALQARVDQQQREIEILRKALLQP